MTIKWHQGHQNTPWGVYSHMMSTVQCNSTDPAARDGGLMMQFYDACHDDGEVEVVQCRQHHVPSKRKLKRFPYQKLRSWEAFLERGISESLNRCGCEFIPITSLTWTMLLKTPSGSGRPVLLHTHALKEHSKTMIEAKNCSWNSYLFTTKSEVV